MPSAYSFIDLAVLDEVRERFARGEALAILSVDLDQVVWVNGPGARLFGEAEIDAVIDASPQLGAAARRQIMATSSYPEIGRDRSVVVRLTAGVESRVVRFLASSVRLPDGEPAIVLAQPSEQASPELAISGLSGPGQFAAILSWDGQVLAASDGFESLGLDAPVLMSLAAETGPGQRVVKRVITASHAAFPAGLARLTDDPAQFLLIVVDEAGAATAEAGEFEAALQEPDPEEALHCDPADLDEAEPLAERPPATPAEAAGEKQSSLAGEPAPRAGDVDGQPDGPDHDGWYFNAADLGVDEEPFRRPVQIDRAAEPVRFVWRTDAEGRFSTISPEFADAVGEEAAAILGRSFSEVANVFGLDAGHEVAGLLERRDTWSGRTVFWPVSGAALRVPVDLAALPVYNRDRQFEGFRGFGVVRLADMVADPEGIGLALVAPASPEASTAAVQADAEPTPDPAGEAVPAAGGRPDDPFRGEVPALALVPKPERRFSDKVIRLAERHAAAPEKGLSPVERSAFREIGERLKKDRRGAGDAAAASEPAPAETAVPHTAAPHEAAEQAASPQRLDQAAHRADATRDSLDQGLDEPAKGHADHTGADNQAGFEDRHGEHVEHFDSPSVGSEDASGTALMASEPSDVEGEPGADEAETGAGRSVLDLLGPVAGDVEAGSRSGEPEAAAGEPGSPVEAYGALVEPAGRRRRRIAFRYEHDRQPRPELGDARGPEAPGQVGELDEINQQSLAPAAALNSELPDAAFEVPDVDARFVEAVEPPPSVGWAGRETAESGRVETGGPAGGEVLAFAGAEAEKPHDTVAGRLASTEDELAILMAAVNRGESELASEEPTQGADTAEHFPGATAGDEPGDGAEGTGGAEAHSDLPGTGYQAAWASAAETPNEDGPAEHENGPGENIEPTGDARPAVRLPRADWAVPDLGAAGGARHDPEAHTPASDASLEHLGDAGSSGSEVANLGPSDFETAGLDGPEQTGADPDQREEIESLQPEIPVRAEAPLSAAAGAPFPDLTTPAPTREPMRAQPLPDWAGAAAPAENEPLEQRIIDRLPVPILIHAGDVLHYANPEFLYLTGYHTLNDLRAAGGLGALFTERYSGEDDSQNRVLRLRTGDGLEFPIEALLRSVSWNNGTALMLVVKRTGEEPSEPGDEPLESVAAPEAGRRAPSETPVPSSERDEPAGEPAAASAETAAPGQLAELQARFAEMRTIMDTATDGVVLILPNGTIRSISRPAEALFGFDSAAVEGKPFTSLFAMESQRAARDYLAGLAEPGVASVLNDGREVIGREAEGRFIPLFMTIGKLPDNGGYCAVMRDITQWKRAEEELTQAKTLAERASTQKTEFLARISHEIRTPLNAIIGFSELMMDERFGPVGNDRYRDYLRDINRSGNHVLDLVNDLLDISKIEAGQQEMNYEAVSLNDTLAETVAMMQPQANRERVIIRSSFASKLPEVVADLRSVRQIALNILSNAIRYTQAGGQVIVSTAYEPSGDIALRVRDTGIGMTTAEIEQALKPFKQINSLRRGRGDGTGLGLPLTKAMVEANRARFTIASTPGEGTLVEVTFPATRVLAG